MNVLFVCTGNTCRSPMAEALFNSVSNDDNHKAFSRGISVFFPQPISKKALTVLNKMGIDARDKYSQQISEEDLKKADLVLTMTSSHKMFLKSSFPAYRDKIYSLKEKAYGKESDIEDPYGQSEEVYLRCLREITEAINEIICSI